MVNFSFFAARSPSFFSFRLFLRGEESPRFFFEGPVFFLFDALFVLFSPLQAPELVFSFGPASERAAKELSSLANKNPTFFIRNPAAATPHFFLNLPFFLFFLFRIVP